MAATSGACKWFSATKGYGFITSDDGTDVFVHQSDITMYGFRKLLPGQRVTYTTTKENGRVKAAGVVPASPPPRRRRPAPRKSNSAPAPPPQPTAAATSSHEPGAIGFGPDVAEGVIEGVITAGTMKAWTHHMTQPKQGQLVILHKPNPNGGVKLMKLNIWCTTGTVGSYLKHPKQGNTQLFRRQISTWSELNSILENPRVHTDKGYQRNARRRPRR